eukprot:901207-Prorocentrum_minimum.AAC.1
MARRSDELGDEVAAAPLHFFLCAELELALLLGAEGTADDHALEPLELRLHKAVALLLHLLGNLRVVRAVAAPPTRTRNDSA